MNSMKLGMIQYAMVLDAAENVAKATDYVREAAAAGAQVICLPELFHTPYFCKIENTALFDYAEPQDGPSVSAMRSLAAELGVVIVVPYFERRAPGLYHNSAAVVDSDGTMLGHYRKMHIPQDPGFEEKFYFTPGDQGFRAWQTRFGKLGVLICWDQWYPEGARLTALAGADLLLYPTAIGWLPSEKDALGTAQHTAWETVQRGHAVANGCYLAAINRVGTEGFHGDNEPTEFWGRSFLSDCYGQVVYRMDTSAEGVAVCELDLRAQEDFRRIWPFFRDRRIDAYGEIAQRWRDG
ncbi:MAG: carbon-nitrogen hydrolase [Opitutales bacterium]